MSDSLQQDGPTGGGHRALIVVLVLFAVAAGLALGRRDVWAPDEPKYALVAHEMVATGQFLVPHVNAEPYPDKPPLLFWSIAAASLLTGGVDQPAAVLPSLLAGLVALAGIWRLAGLLAPGRRPLAPLLAAGLAAVSYRFFSQAIVGQIDMLLAACTTWSFVLLFDGLGLAPGRPPRRGAVTGGLALAGLGLLAKGPVAVLLPLGGVLTGAAVARRRPAGRLLGRPAPWLAFLGVIFLWLGPAIAVALSAGLDEWVHDLLFRQTVVRYAASWHHHQPFWYFLVIPWADFFPAIALLPPAIVGLWRKDRDEEVRTATRLLAGACLFILVFFSIPSGKRGVYLLPAYPIAATWLGIELSWRLTSGRGRGALRWAGFAAAAVCLLLAVGLALEGADAAAEIGAYPPVLPLAIQMGLVGCGLLAIGLTRGGPRALVVAGLLWFSFYAFATGAVIPALDRALSARTYVEAIETEVVPGTQGAMIDFRAQFGLHAGRLDTAQPGDAAEMRALGQRLASGHPYWVVTKEVYVDELRAALPPGAQVVEILRRHVGDDVYVTFATPAALPATNTGPRRRQR